MAEFSRIIGENRQIIYSYASAAGVIGIKSSYYIFIYLAIFFSFFLLVLKLCNGLKSVPPNSGSRKIISEKYKLGLSNSHFTVAVNALIKFICPQPRRNMKKRAHVEVASNTRENLKIIITKKKIIIRGLFGGIFHFILLIIAIEQLQQLKYGCLCC